MVYVMEFHLFPVFTFLALTLLVASHGAHVSPQAYWNTVLPNSPMPKAVKTHLPSSGDAGGFYGGGYPFNTQYGKAYKRAGQSDGVQHYVKLGQTLFFLEKDMKQGTVLNLDLAKDIKGVTFIPREASQSMPFSSEKITDVLNQFSFAPNSKEAELVKQTIRECEEPHLAGEHKYCATSLEAMVDYSTSMLGRNVRALSTELSKETGLHKYTFTEIKKLGGRGDGEIVVCHMQNYAYAVFYCHMIPSTTAYAVTLAGADGTKGSKAVAVCHHDTSSWNPMHISFQMLRVKPGTATICHILPEDTIIWVPLK